VARVRSSVRVTSRPAERELNEVLRALDGAELWVGIASAKDPDSEIVKYATKNEFGDLAPTDGGPRVPERSFMRSTFDAQLAKWGRRVASALQQPTGAGVLQGLELVGVIAVGDVVNTINSSVPPPNAPATLAAKGPKGTLINSGRMKQSIFHELVAGDGQDLATYIGAAS
jgi:hypothetical protein